MEEKLIEIVKKVLELAEDTMIKYDADLQELGLDSMTCVDVVVNLEEEFGVTVDEEDLLIENMSSIDALVELVKKYQ